MVYRQGGMVYFGSVALNIKNSQTVELARRLASQTGMTQTGAITYALRRSLEPESGAGSSSRRARVDRLLQVIWQSHADGDDRRIQRNMDGLYDHQGLPR